MKFELDHARGVPVYRQIYEAVVRGLATGALARGEQLPTIHQLATKLGINPNTVARSYRDLERDGHLVARRGRGTFTADSSSPPADARASILADLFRRAVEEGASHAISAREISDYFRRATRHDK